MPKKDVFESKIKSTGPFNFREFYNFCFDWLGDETNLIVVEEKYIEKNSGDSKGIEAAWTAFRKITDYFKYQVSVTWRVIDLHNVEYEKKGKKIKTNFGTVQIKIKGTVFRDYEGKFQDSPFNAFLNKIYEKWVIKSRIEHYEDKLIAECDEFLDQAKAFLAAEAQKADIVQT
jgi:hypothetical protein